MCILGKQGDYKLIGQTEIIKDETNPQFTKSIEIA
jgi:hypothetical protein